VRAQLERQASERSAVFAELADIVVDAAQPPDVIVDTLLPEL
jgi:hypothetical protein